MVAFVRYIFAAGAATCVDIALVQSLLTFDFRHNDGFFALAICAGALAGTATNFTLSRYYVFSRDGRPAFQQLSTFALISLSTLLLRLVVAYGLLAVLTLPLLAAVSLLPFDAAPERVAYFGAVGLVMIYSYIAHKHVSFAGGLFRIFQNSAVVSR